MSETTYHKDPLRPETVGAPDQAPQHPHQAGSSLTTYFIIFTTLMVLLVLTVVVAHYNLGSLNIVIWMSIAFLKALLVVLFFMHVIESSRLTKVFVFGTMLWIAIMFGFTFIDYSSRGWLGHSQGWDENPSIVHRHGQQNDPLIHVPAAPAKAEPAEKAAPTGH